MWNGVKWSTSPMLNYDYTVDGIEVLSKIENAVRAGDYALAKEEFFIYMKNRDNVIMPELEECSLKAELALRNTFVGPGGEDLLVGTVNITDEWNEIRYDITNCIEKKQ